MFRFERIEGLLNRLATYSPIEVLIELALIWIVVYAAVRFVRGTRAAGALKGLLVLIILIYILARILGQGHAFQRLAFLYDRFLTIAAVGLLIIFQPELRRALVRLGETPFFRQSSSELALVVDAIVEAVAYLSKAKFGAIIVLERSIKVRGLVEGGTTLNARVSAELLQTIFFPGAALHDLAVIIAGSTVQTAGAQLPLAEPGEMPDRHLGSRHRAAVGLSKECDALVIVVSEESGHMRIAERGRLSQPLDPASLRFELLRRLRQRPTPHRSVADAREVNAEEPPAPDASAESRAGAMEIAPVKASSVRKSKETAA